MPEGIRLFFDNIPANTNWLYVQYNDWGGKDTPKNYYDGTGNFAFIQETSVIEQLKETNTLILPFVQAGHKYTISTAIFLNREGEVTFDDNGPIISETECIADNGIDFGESIKLDLNDTQTSVTLSSKPQFTPVEISYTLTLLYSKNENGFATISIGDIISKNILFRDGLTWNFEPEMSDYLKQGDQIKNGVNYPAYFTAHLNVIYDNISWSIQIAKSREFSYFY